MTVDFYKYQGAGNDFVILDGRNNELDLYTLQIRKMCDRKFGIGADGLMVLKNHEGYDFSMTYYNADGKEGSMCGNGGRCILAFSQRIGILKNPLSFIAIDGPHEGEIIKENDDEAIVKLKMLDVSHYESNDDHFVIDTGSPHFIQFTNNLSSKNVFEDGRKVRNNETFKNEGINVNFVESNNNELFVRTYERGVEDETLACGTGVTASTLALAIKNNLTQECIQIKTLGGDLKVSFNKVGDTFKDIWLEGPATFVFKGHITI
jgi:diaminopimelate epimerase